MVEGEKRSFRKGCVTGIFIGTVTIFSCMSLYTVIVSRRTVKTTGAATEYYPSYSSHMSAKGVPDFIIIGVRKGGTRALISMLASHPRIVSANGEVHFFDRDERYQRLGMKWYIGRMPSSQEDQLVVEKTPSYFVTNDVPKRVSESFGSKPVKFLVIVRDPVMRAVSDYTQLDAKKMQRNRPRPSFEEAAFKPDGNIRNTTSVIRDSLYDVHFSRWLGYFHSDRFLILDGDLLVTDPVKVLMQVEKFFGLESYFTNDKVYFNETKGFYCWKTLTKSSKCLGSAKGRKHPEISDETRSKLEAFFRPHMESFCKMAHINFTFCHPNNSSIITV